MENGIIELGYLQVAYAFVFIAILLLIVRIKGIKRERDILIGSIRMTIQLVITGYVLGYIFEHKNPWFTIIYIIIMEVFATFNTYKRVKIKLQRNLKIIISFSIVTGTIISLSYFLLIVVRISPWYDPRYFIPIAGMIVGNSMTGITLGVTRLVDGMKTQRHLIEGSLMLGITPKDATKHIVNNAFDSAILPTINNMVGMGIVSLPGMMTGQILSGTSPTLAIQYQIAIMLAISGSVALTVVIFVQMAYKTFFNDRSQLVLD